MHLDNPFDQGQANTRAVAPRVKLIEQPEDPVKMFRSNPNPVIAHEEDGFASFRFIHYPADVNMRFPLIAHEFGSVFEQILHYLHQPRTVAEYNRQSFIDLQGDSSLQHATC